MEGEIITLDVGGTIFKISTVYLTKCEFFRVMLEDIPYTGEAIYIDRSPHIFKHILSYLRDSSYPYPKKYIQEVDYFLIDAADVNKYDPMEDINSRLAQLACEAVSKQELRRIVGEELKNPCNGNTRTKTYFGGNGKTSCNSRDYDCRPKKRYCSSDSD